MTQTAHLANAVIIFLGSLAAAALLIAAFNDPFNQIMTTAGTIGSSAEATTGRNIIQQAWDLLPFIVVFIGLVQLIGAAARESKI
jgi:hypothetical protein